MNIFFNRLYNDNWCLVSLKYYRKPLIHINMINKYQLMKKTIKY